MRISSGKNAVGCEDCAGVRIATLRIAGVYTALRGGAQQWPLRFLSAKSALKCGEFTWRPEWIGKGYK
jgi:hypothetical protein